ncbi:MAG: hypothetical protein N0C81_16725 [Candidatus Thiodiazotropha lotti]|uniref:Uncharacterized protein n=1 Tax=Candidatus Thiodiazotropha lotti TaxID=2792787 RepID=A0A9E4MZ67_9GAMM|nr:hypothetical protein [Candidatus Thiodiazotropha lotti]MCG7937234.1 hypothetical protein [Candidatus Thiodiazotropha lotti]MCG8004215.1 hypothetical protein [Candidatus Thiodiazotropha lotti]MCG8009274.1 hypothetical protein [Candidatus Thiodiazotropha lotti]MCW4187835.1 hypothetical protein [Candidatus Thiodiazotropha lotti]
MVKRLVMPGWSFFTEKANAVDITRSKVLKLKFNKAQEWEIHGLVFVDPSESAHEMIGRLNAASKLGRRLHAHPYIHRESSRDRRRLVLDLANRYPGDRRRQDRRRISLASQVVDAIN